MEFTYEYYLPGEGPKELIEDFIKRSDSWFYPKLSLRVDIVSHASKLYAKGTKFLCMENERILGLTVIYANKAPLFSFGSYTVVDPEFDGLGIGLTVTAKAIKYAKEYGSAGFKLKMRADNRMLLKFYQRMGFGITAESCFSNTDIKEIELTKIF